MANLVGCSSLGHQPDGIVARINTDQNVHVSRGKWVTRADHRGANSIGSVAWPVRGNMMGCAKHETRSTLVETKFNSAVRK